MSEASAAAPADLPGPAGGAPVRTWRLSPRTRTALAAALGLAALAGAIVWRSPAFWTSRGNAALRGSRLVDAEHAFHRAIDLDPDRAEALYGLGWAYLRAELPHEARARFKRCAEVAPGYAGCQRGLGALAVADGAMPVAEKHLRRAHELAPDDPGVLSSLAELYARAGRFDEAQQLHLRAIAREPYLGEYRIGYAETLLSRGDLDGCERVVAEAESLSFREARFRVALKELRARAELVRAARLVEGEGSAGAPQVRARVRAHLDRADALLDEASAFGFERGAVNRVRRAVQTQRESLLDAAHARSSPPGTP